MLGVDTWSGETPIDVSLLLPAGRMQTRPARAGPGPPTQRRSAKQNRFDVDDSPLGDSVRA